MDLISDIDFARVGEAIEAEARADYYRRAPADLAARMGIEARRCGPLWLTMIPAVDIEFLNRVVGLGLLEDATEAMLDGVIAVLRGAGCTNYQVQLSPMARPARIADWLTARGFVAAGHWAKWRRGPASPLPVRTDLRLESIGVEKADAFADLIITVFSMPRELLPLMGGMVGAPGWSHYLAFDSDRPVAAGALFVQDGIGWLGFGSTLESHRGRGAQGALLARRIQDGIDRGCRWFVSETRDDTPENPSPSFRNMMRSGFTLAYRRCNWAHRGEV